MEGCMAVTAVEAMLTAVILQTAEMGSMALPALGYRERLRISRVQFGTGVLMLIFFRLIEFVSSSGFLFSSKPV